MTINTIALGKTDALIIVDVQMDFCPGGALAVPDGDAVIPVLNAWIRKAVNSGAAVYASRDWHPGNHVSFTTAGGPWPPHCVQDTEGAGFHFSLELPESAEIITKGVRFDKDQNSIFDDTGLHEHLRKNAINRLFIGGLAQDICVRASVLDALKAGFEVVVIENGTRPIAKTDGQLALKQMKDSGAMIYGGGIASDPQVCTKVPDWAEHARFKDQDDVCDDGRSGRL